MWNMDVSRSRCCAVALLLILSGCTGLSDAKYELGQKIRTQQAWRSYDGCHGQAYTLDYSTGWKAGYYDVATGGEGCPPVVAPRRYWKPPVFCEYDPSRRDEWYCGFQDGAACAKSQPDHHYLKAFLPPSTCCPVQNASCSQVVEQPNDLPIEHIVVNPDQGVQETEETEATLPVLDAASADVEPAAPAPTAPTEVAPEPPTLPMPTLPMPQPSGEPAPSATEDYEDNPAPASVQPAPAETTTLQERLIRQYQEQLRQHPHAKQASLLEQLVLNAGLPPEDSDF
jgi:hypothetical protein